MYLRDLPEPLLTFSLWDKFLSCIKFSSGEEAPAPTPEVDHQAAANGDPINMVAAFVHHGIHHVCEVSRQTAKDQQDTVVALKGVLKQLPPCNLALTRR